MMKRSNKAIANAIRRKLSEINLLINKAKENGLIVKFKNNEFSLGKEKYLLEVEVCEKVIY